MSTVLKDHEQTSETALTENKVQNSNVIDGHANLLDVELWLNQETIDTSGSYSTTLSLEDSMHPSMGESSYIQEDYLQHWVDSVDTMLSWEAAVCFSGFRD